MRSLQTVAMGLVLVFLDVNGASWDLIPDPVGWILVLVGLSPLKELLPNYRGVTLTAGVCLAESVLTYPPGSVDHLAPFLGWLFSLPTIAFAFVLCDALMDVATDGLEQRFGWLRWAFVAVGALPLGIYGMEWEWLKLPTAVLAVAVNVALVVTLWSAGDEEEESQLPESLRNRQSS